MKTSLRTALRKSILMRAKNMSYLLVAGCLGTSAMLHAAIQPLPIDEDGYTQTIIEEGRGWQLVQIDGKMDATGEPFSELLYMINDKTGIAEAPLPASLKESMMMDLASSTGEETRSFSLPKAVVDEVEISDRQGKPTEALIRMSEMPIDPDPALKAMGVVAKGCNDQTISRSGSFNVNTPLNSNFNIGSGFTGNLSLTGNAAANATGTINMLVKRAKIWFICVPYGVRFQSAQVAGNVAVNNGASLTGTINYANPNAQVWNIAKPHLFSLNFWAGPIPVHIGFNLPITAGFDQGGITGNVTGNVTYSSQQQASGSINYTCTSSGCTGNNTLSLTNLGPQPLTSSISGRFQPNVYAQVAVRGYLYSEGIAYAQAGVRPYLRGDLWGYYGNTCGDGNGDGINETVQALTADLDWQLYITAQADTFLTSTWYGTLWTSPRWHIGFWDLLGGSGSTAMSPMISGLSSIPTNSVQTYGARMRPCFPYTDNVNYSMNWGDGSPLQALNGPAASVTNATHSWLSPSTPTLTLTALNDSHGRSFNKATSRVITVSNAAPINKALTATASASSTYCSGVGTIHCYSPARVNDGNNSTALGGFTSWSNNTGVTMPQWVRIDWNSPQNGVSQIKVFTTSGYELKDFQVQVLSGNTVINNIAFTNNTASSVTVPLVPMANNVTAVRILASSGPAIQVNHARVNEIEVY